MFWKFGGKVRKSKGKKKLKKNCQHQTGYLLTICICQL
jgi:hypothetical protein